jgi:hypothetical protein
MPIVSVRPNLSSSPMLRRVLPVVFATTALSCSAPKTHTATTAAGDVATDVSATGPGADRVPNEMGRIPVLEYHLIGEGESRWKVDREHFRRMLDTLYVRGYRPVTVNQLVDRHIDLPAGLSPVVLVFDDASPEQFRYIEKGGALEIDSTSAVGILLAFHKKHPDWENRAVFCTLSGAAAGHNLFGDRGVQGQQTGWRFQKMKFLADQGFELCNHTLWHAQLNKYSDTVVQEQIARGQMSIDSAVPGYRVRTFALPQGLWPKNAPLAWGGSWQDPKSRRTINYGYDAVLEVAGGPSRSPFDPQFDPHHIPRVEVFAMELERLLDRLDRTSARYVSDGDPRHIANPAQAVAKSEAPE